MSSAKHKFEIVLPPMLTVDLWMVTLYTVFGSLFRILGWWCGWDGGPPTSSKKTVALLCAVEYSIPPALNSVHDVLLMWHVVHRLVWTGEHGPLTVLATVFFWWHCMSWNCLLQNMNLNEDSGTGGVGLCVCFVRPEFVVRVAWLLGCQSKQMSSIPQTQAELPVRSCIVYIYACFLCMKFASWGVGDGKVCRIILSIPFSEVEFCRS